MAIIVTKGGKAATRLEMTAPDKEDYLQSYIYHNPESIPLYEIKEDIRFVILVREFKAGSGAVDALGVDAEGEIYLVETKLYKNPDKRRVLAQVLDYGASLWALREQSGELLSRIDKEVQDKHTTGLREYLRRQMGLQEEELQSLLENFAMNLGQGKFKFVVLMDRLHEELKNLILFVNQNSSFKLFAVELEFYKFDDYEITIPKLFGSEVNPPIGSGRSKWDKGKFFQAAAKLEKQQLQALEDLYNFSETAATVTWGTGSTRGSFAAKFVALSRKSLYWVYSDGQLVINFGALRESDTQISYRDRFKSLLEHIRGFDIPENYRDAYPTFAIEVWSPRVDEFIQAVKSVFGMGAG